MKENMFPPEQTDGHGKPQRPHISPGYRVGRLTVAAPTKLRKAGYTIWDCRCDCGGGILLDTRALQRGTVTDCGCVSRVAPGQRDISGRRFGKLAAVEPTGQTERGSVVWRCRCDCGGQVCTTLHQLISGYRRSCGCMSRAVRKDYVGKRFGRLTVTAYAGKYSGMHRWRCLCDCGKETVVGQTLLQTGKTRSCGCLQTEICRKNLKLVDGTSVTMLASRKNKLNRNNTSGFTGVYWNQKQKKWTAQISFKGKTYYLGSFADQEDAVKARRRGEEELHDRFLSEFAQKAAQQAAGG